MATQRMICGGPHFSGNRRQIRNSSYSIETALCDIIDNPIGLADTIIITEKINDENILYEYMIDDNYDMDL